MKRNETSWIVSLILSAGLISSESRGQEIYHAQGEMSGEVTATSVQLQTRLTATLGLDDQGDIQGAVGVARFEWDTDRAFANKSSTSWMASEAGNDFIIRAIVNGLEPGVRYYYRVVSGSDQNSAKPGPIRTFRTLPGYNEEVEVRFTVGSCMNYHSFMNGERLGGAELSTTPEDLRLGYPSFSAMATLRPDFFVGTGDIVYYDYPRTEEEPAAQSLPELRKKWHEQFRFPRLVEFFGSTAAYWSKDDHDFRYDDADLTGDKLPLAQTGIDLFREQLPIVDSKSPTYRTHRISRHLQIWLTEGRDHRSPKAMEDGPGKTLWGPEQRDWLQRTLKGSDATWKILISPTPMVGPDRATKKDNHTNLGGYRHEALEFFNWLESNQIQGFMTICGDRHWQFHSIHPMGIEEFGCGALNDENAIPGTAPGTEGSTDPHGLIKQPFKYSEPTGGFLHVISRNNGALKIEFRDDLGKVLYAVEK